MKQYLKSCELINWQHPSVKAKALSLAGKLTNDEDIAKACFIFVRDEVKHSWDFQLNPLTCRASDVLEFGTGFCYAKSHLLAALLRASGIPAGLCYQRLTVSDNRPPFCLHGLNAVFLKKYGWYRVDPRGNKPGVNALFKPPQEHLAFPITVKGEADLPGIWSEPSQDVITAMSASDDIHVLANNLPDIALIE